MRELGYDSLIARAVKLSRMFKSCCEQIVQLVLKDELFTRVGGFGGRQGQTTVGEFLWGVRFNVCSRV